MFDTTFEARHWWIWFWQLYSVRITLSWYLMQYVGAFLQLPKIHSTLGYRTKAILALAPFIAIAVGLWAYTALYCPYSLSTVFYIHPLAEDIWVLRMRRLLQFDQVYIWGSSVLWVAMDMRRNRLSSGMEIILAGVILAGIVGPGASFGLLWLWREWKVAADSEKDVLKLE